MCDNLCETVCLSNDAVIGIAQALCVGGCKEIGVSDWLCNAHHRQTPQYGYSSKGHLCNPSITHIFHKLFVKQEVLALILLECQTFFSWKMFLSFHLSCSISLSEAREGLSS